MFDSSPDLAPMTVRPHDSLRHAMGVIDQNGIELAFVVDEGRRVVGTLSDGDIRRAILRGTSLDTPSVGDAMCKRFTWVGPDVGRAEVLDLMRALSISQVPVLDADGKMLGLHLLYEILGPAKRPNGALIMAGGKGERLRPLTSDLPKPMIPVAGRPILERLVLQLVGAGIREIWLSVHYLAHVIEEHFGDGRKFGCAIRYVHEPAPLGTAGALALLPEVPRDPLLVMNGDLVTQVDLGGVLDHHAEGQHALTMCLKPFAVEVPYGVADVEGGRVVGLREKPTQHMLINSGIYVLSPAALALVPKTGGAYAMTSLVGACLDRGLLVGAHVLDNEWIDVGQPDQLRAARGE